jgi:hypothetical protein
MLIYYERKIPLTSSSDLMLLGRVKKKPRTSLTLNSTETKASFSSVNWGEKHCIRISVAFRLYLEVIIQILTNWA